ncbi:MAG: gliding motility-associated C-terminal domain-containing protein [Flavobacteriales bacterium]|nr:gliding motility-associated C-terminal domain-containing protein [Flavobacteriales bacterium]
MGKGVFTWNIQSGACPVSSDEVLIEIGYAPNVDAGPDLYTQGVARVRVQVEVNQPSIINWEPSIILDEIDQLVTSANIEETTELVVSATSEPFCTRQDTLKIRVLSPVEINTVFTPDGDDINDELNIEGSESYPKMKVVVFNRWGAKVYESDDGYKTKFDGKHNGNLLPVSSYYYVIEFNDGITDPRDGNLTIIY